VEKKEVLELLGNRVKEIRLSKGMTQTELANKIGKDHPSINRLEKGKINPSYYFLFELSEGLEIELKDLFY
jgi:transcriptional regulator with XRE-family HTH domain